MQTINTIKVCSDKTQTEVWINGVRYYVCHVCGRLSIKKQTRNGKIYCSKHYKQEWRKGKLTDTNPRTAKDLNEIRIYDNYAEMDIYNSAGQIIATTLIDTEMVDKVKNIKWCLGTKNYILTNHDHNGNKNILHRVIMDAPDNLLIDHINHNTLDNRCSNLRPATQYENCHNQKIIPKGFKFHKPTQKWQAGITEQNNQIHLGLYDTIEEAQFARQFAESVLRGDFAYKRDPTELAYEKQSQIIQYVLKQLEKYIDIFHTGKIPPLAWNNPNRPVPINNKNVTTPTKPTDEQDN